MSSSIYVCPECDSDLDDSAPDGGYCHTCREWYSQEKIDEWILTAIKENDRLQEEEWLSEHGEADPDLEDPDLED